MKAFGLKPAEETENKVAFSRSASVGLFKIHTEAATTKKL